MPEFVQTFSGNTAQVAAFKAELLDIYHGMPEATVVGSVGRQATLAALGAELPPLSLHPPGSGRGIATPRDIDVFSTEYTFGIIVSRYNAGKPQHPVDGRPSEILELPLEDNLFLNITNGAGLTARRPVDPAVFQPVERQLDDVRIRTLPVSTQLALARFLRPYAQFKDIRNNRDFDRRVSALPSSTLDDADILPASLYEPFWAVRRGACLREPSRVLKSLARHALCSLHP